jgi:hypothetical protein
MNTYKNSERITVAVFKKISRYFDGLSKPTSNLRIDCLQAKIQSRELWVTE